MRKFLMIGAAVCFVAGCQTVSGQSGQLTESDIRPIEGSITIGNASVQGAEYQSKNRLTLRQGGQSGHMETRMKALLDADFSSKKLQFLMEIVDAEMNVVNLTVDKKAAEALKSLKGIIVEMTFDVETSAFSAHVQGDAPGSERTAAFDLGGGDKEKEKLRKVLNLLAENYLGGKTVRQGQEVMRFDLMQLLGGSSLSKAVVSGRVIGQSVYKERPVVVVKAISEIVGKDQRLDTDSVYYVDMFTGISVFGTLGFSGVEKDGMQIAVQLTQTVDLTRNSNKMQTRH